MIEFEAFTEYHLLAKVFVIETEFGGRKGPIFDDYRGQFFWHINGEACSDWDARYVFEGGSVSPGKSALCKIVVSGNLLKYSGGSFPVGVQFGIREGSRIVAVGVIKSSKVANASQNKAPSLRPQMQGVMFSQVRCRNQYDQG